MGQNQGDPSSSLLFMTFINDIIDNINTDLEGIFTVEEIQLFMLLYADDVVVFICLFEKWDILCYGFWLRPSVCPSICP